MSNANFQTELLGLQGNLLNFAYMLTSNRDDAYDLLQDTTLKALDNADKFAENTNLKNWVYTIMRNIFINNYRRATRRATVVDTTDNLYLINLSAESTCETPEGACSAEEITKAIGALPEEYRDAFSLFVAGYKYGEIAEQLNIPLGTVKSRIFVARKHLQGQFADAR